MLLTIDIGNSNIVFSLSGSERKLHRLETMPDRSAEEYLPQVAELFSREKVDLSVVDGAVLCSVVPELVPVMSRVTRELTGLTPYVISPASESGLTLAIAWRRTRRQQRNTPSRPSFTTWVPPPPSLWLIRTAAT